MRAAQLGLLLFLAPSCASTPIAPYTLDESPLEYLQPSAGFSDQRARFREILCAVNEAHGETQPDRRTCDEILHRFSDEPVGTGEPVDLGTPQARLRIAFVSGFGAECISGVVNAFSFALAHLEGHGYQVAGITVDGLSSSARNGRLIRDAVLSMDIAPDEQLVLVGYSKGVPDILEGLAAHLELTDRVTAVISVAGAVYGSPLAENAPGSLLPMVAYMPGSECDVGDGGALDSLKSSTRKAFADANPPPATVRFFSLAAFGEREQISRALRGSYDDLAPIDPRNDSQLLFYDQIVAGSALLGFAAADHWAIALPVAREHPFLSSAALDRNAFPREVVLEALVRHVEEQLIAAAAADSLREPDAR